MVFLCILGEDVGVLYILKGFISIYVNFFFRGGYLFYIHVFILGEGGSFSAIMVSNCFLFWFSNVW